LRRAVSGSWIYLVTVHVSRLFTVHGSQASACAPAGIFTAARPRAAKPSAVGAPSSPTIPFHSRFVMKKFLTLSFAALLCAQSAAAQQQSAKPTQKKTGAPNVGQKPAQTRARATPQPVGLTEYGIEIGPDPRLVVMMAALDAAGWDPTPAGERPSVFRELVRKDQAALDPVLRKRMQY